IRAVSTLRLATAGSATSGQRFFCANKRAHEFALDFLRHRIYVDSLRAQKRASIFDAVDPSRLKIDFFEPGPRELLKVIRVLQGSGDAAHPEEHMLPDFLGNIAAHYHIGHGEASARF